MCQHSVFTHTVSWPILRKYPEMCWKVLLFGWWLGKWKIGKLLRTYAISLLSNTLNFVMVFLSKCYLLVPKLAEVPILKFKRNLGLPLVTTSIVGVIQFVRFVISAPPKKEESMAETNLSELKIVDDEAKKNAENLKEQANNFFKSECHDFYENIIMYIELIVT